MSSFALLYTLHLLAATIWVGGMFFAWMILRPAVGVVLQAPERLGLWAEVFPRFFQWVWGAVIVLPVTGIGMLHLRFSGFETAPVYVHLMIGLFLAMLALFLRICLLQVPQLRRAVAEQNWSAGGAALGHIRRQVGLNLLLGLTLMAIAGARPLL